MCRISKSQIRMMEKIGELEPVSFPRLDITKKSFRTFQILVEQGLVEHHSKGLLGDNWKLSEKGRRFIPV